MRRFAENVALGTIVVGAILAPLAFVFVGVELADAGRWVEAAAVLAVPAVVLLWGIGRAVE